MRILQKNETAELDFVRADGKRTMAVESIKDGTNVKSNEFTWTYDAVDRLISETLNDVYGSEDYNLEWVYDLAGNRRSQTKLSANIFGAPVSEVTSYLYDANDRLTSETSGNVPTTYLYNKTQQTGKVVGTKEGVSKAFDFAYDLQGLLASVTETKTTYADPNDPNGNGSDIVVHTRTVYDYDFTGTRVGSAQYAYQQLPDQDWDSWGWIMQSKTEYLTDTQNHTGYSQVLQETTYTRSQEAGVVPFASKKVIYAIGHDQVNQTTLTSPDGTNWTNGSVAYFGTDGHGSVRVLYDFAGAVIRQSWLAQIYTFDAYGNLLGWGNAQPMTSYLYSGESFDFNIGQQYLGARFYDATTGRFNRLDPFFGNSSDPQSFHKYAYVHGDPVNAIDPTGMFWQGLYSYAKKSFAELSILQMIRSALLPTGAMQLRRLAAGQIAKPLAEIASQATARWVFGVGMGAALWLVERKHFDPVDRAIRMLAEEIRPLNADWAKTLEEWMSHGREYIDEQGAWNTVAAPTTTGQLGGAFTVGNTIHSAIGFLSWYNVFMEGIATESSKPIKSAGGANINASIGVTPDFQYDFQPKISQVAKRLIDGTLQLDRPILALTAILKDLKSGNFRGARADMLTFRDRLSEYGKLRVTGSVDVDARTEFGNRDFDWNWSDKTGIQLF